MPGFADRLAKRRRGLDDTQRAIAATLGVGLVLGAIAWVTAVTLPSPKDSWELRILVPAAMAVLGAEIVILAWRGRHGQRALEKAIQDGRALLLAIPVFGPITSETFAPERSVWEFGARHLLGEEFGLREQREFDDAWAKGGDERSVITIQVEYLESLRGR